jgi:hypothetical protein
MLELVYVAIHVLAPDKGVLVGLGLNVVLNVFR